jgi:hypothetical protein
MIVELNVPYEEREQAKKMGCRWNPVKKTWYVVDVDDLSVFSKWFYYWQAKPNNEREHKNGKKPKSKTKHAKIHKVPNIKHPITIGCNYVENHSNEPPWR